MSSLALVSAALGGAALLAAAVLLVVLDRRRRVRARLFADVEVESPPPEASGGRGSALRRWLVSAGFRHRAASRRFVAACLVGAVLGAGVAVALAATPLLASLRGAALALPVVGGAAGGVVGLAPWALGALVAASPWLHVRGVRRRRVEAIEQDLPLQMELLATLAEAGLGFDASIALLLDSEPTDRALADELRLFQLEALSGAGRSACLRRLAERVDLPILHTIVAALVQAEETGGGLADMLRPLAEDQRHRLRERTLARVEALPERLVVPLLVGFLPSLFVWTLGPAFFQLFGMLDAMAR